MKLNENIMNTEVAKEVAEYLLENEAVKISLDPPFTYTSGIKSPIYCDNRLMIAFPKARKFIVEGLKAMIEDNGLKPDVIGGTATAAIPWAAFVAYDLDLPMVYIRPKKKKHGSGKQIEGSLEGGKKVLIIEDLVSTGGSSVAAAEVVRGEGKCEVGDVFAIMQYGMESSVNRFDEANLNLSALTNFDVVLDVLEMRGDFEANDIDIIKSWKANPKAWGDKHCC